MRILTVSAFYESHGGGIELVAGALARALARRGHECRWAAAAFDPPPDALGVAPSPLDAFDPIERRLGLPMPLLTRGGRRVLADEIAMADAVIVHDALYASSVLATREARRARKPWALIQHIGPIPYKSSLLRGALTLANCAVTQPMLARASRAVFISDGVRRHFGEVAYRAPPLLLFNGVDHNVFTLTSSERRAEMRRELGLDGERPQFLFVGRFVEKKGLTVLEHLARHNPQWDFQLVGSGPIDPAKWGLANVRLRGRKTSAELADLYAAVDGFVLPSTGEGFPLVVQEAMACGLPVYCGSDSAEADPGAARFLHGIDVDLTDPGGTAKRFALAMAQGAPSPNAEMAAHAHAAYDWDANAAALEKALLERAL